MTHDPMVVIRTAEPPAPSTAAHLLQEATDELRPQAVVDDLEAALEELRAARGEVALVVVGPGVERPLSVGRELRRADESVGLLYVAATDDAARLRLDIGMLAELGTAEVMDAGRSSHQLAEDLRAASTAAARRHRTNRAIEALNRQLAGRSREDLRRAADATVPESYLAAIVRHVPEAIVSVDPDRRVVAFNDAAVELFGLRPDQSLDTALRDALRREPSVQNLIDTALDGVTASAEELEVDVEEGTAILAVTAAPVRDHSGTVIGAVLVARDMTTQRRSEERLRQLQKAQSLATLAGGVAHDFNNLLVTVRSWAQLAAEDPDDRELLETALERIGDAADRAAELARSMLVYSGRGQFELAPVEVNPLVRQMTELLRGSISRKIDLRLDLDDELPLVEAAASQLRQVLMNLITNAAEAIGDEDGAITVRTRQLADAFPSTEAELAPVDRYALLEVTDTGPGMDRETVERAFEPFFTTKFEGRGLGLAASHGIVRAHGGTLTVESRLGEGATFRMTLPVWEEGTS